VKIIRAVFRDQWRRLADVLAIFIMIARDGSADAFTIRDKDIIVSYI